MANILNANVGGLSVSYDLGPSLETVSSQAYAFLNNSFTSDQSLLKGAIAGANNLVTGITAPTIAMATAQQRFNLNDLPGMFEEVNNQNFDIAQQALQTQAQTAESSIAASRAEAANAPQGGGGGFCYITTAVCETLGLPDDNPILNTLRHFRDSFMGMTPERRAMVNEYYETAPALLQWMVTCDDWRELCERILFQYLMPSVRYIASGDHPMALLTYRAMLSDMRAVMRSNLP